jgi:hypothetical protein
MKTPNYNKIYKIAEIFNQFKLIFTDKYKFNNI